jgi:3-methyladenine DNA glycosylase AlkD
MKAAQNPESSIFLQRFFKTAPGEYGEGDMFLGLRVPTTRAIVKKYYIELSFADLDALLQSKWHEIRFAAVVAMTLQYPRANEVYKKQLYDLYIKQVGKGINNWDIIDVSCPRIIGAYLLDKDPEPLYALAKGDLWQKRVSIISTFWHLKYNDPTLTYNLAELLVYEREDLLQKAVGWSVREIGKRDGQLLRQFLDKYAATMPRTALRYALDHLPTKEKEYYMSLKRGNKN